MFAKALLAVPLVALCISRHFFSRDPCLRCLLVVSAQDCTRTYTVQSGDICDNISAANNVST